MGNGFFITLRKNGNLAHFLSLELQKKEQYRVDQVEEGQNAPWLFRQTIT